ncbi:MAG: DUF4212 domain-containing protein [Burkholderiaceae bacterium]
MNERDAPTLSATQRRAAVHWARTRRLTLLLSAAWFAVTVLVILLARPLSGLTLFGWPVSFYLAAQGAVLAYLAIVGAYAWRMRRLDRESRGESDER